MTLGDPRPPRRIVDRQLLRGLHALPTQPCRACGHALGASLHHLVSKGQRGDDVPPNLVWLCGGGTNGCHGSLTDHHPASWPSRLHGKPWTVVAAALRSNLTSIELDYVLAKKGQDWLDRALPAQSS